MNILAVIGARAGSVRCPGKNTRRLPDGTTLTGRAIRRAQAADLFVVLSTDIEDGWWPGSIRTVRRPPELATATTRDVEWIAHALDEVGGRCDAVAIIRPTSPFLKAETVRRGVEMYDGKRVVRAVRPISEHPSKMWAADRLGQMAVHGGWFGNPEDAWCDGPTQTIKPAWAGYDGLYVQTGGLDIVSVRNIRAGYLTGGEDIQPLIVDGWEGLDVNVEADWLLAETAIDRGLVF